MLAGLTQKRRIEEMRDPSSTRPRQTISMSVCEMLSIYKKDMLISRGFNVHPVEIEKVISKHPLVNMVAVIGIPSKKWRKEVKAVVVAVKDAEITKDNIVEFCG